MSLRSRLVVALSALVASALACESPREDARPAARAPATAAPLLRDDFGDTIPTGRTFARIVSLNPTTTEALFAMGAGARLVGRSHWDQWPAEAQRLPDLGPGIRPNLEVILAARPDLVLLYASADNRPVATRLRAAGIATYSSKVDAIAAFREMLRTLGALTGDTARARVVVDSVDRTLAAVRARTVGRAGPRVLLPAWESPLLVIGGGSHMSELVEIAGGRNVYGDTREPSPQVAFEDVVRRDPDVLLTSPAGLRRILASPQWRALRAVREGRAFAYDTMVVGRPSVTMGAAAANLASLLHARGP
ncbi:MAG TPA: helical backbone metal receptor [Gemmatimonadaceae bacterium]|nr:helical backbone metal receptor [Gemmatimonadaceae bacterium]